MIHEDERRILISMPYKEGEIKLIICKEDCELGNHYHKEKTEEFQLLDGFGIAKVNGSEFIMVGELRKFKVLPESMHTFKMRKDSVLFCIASHKYNEKDDYHE